MNVQELVNKLAQLPPHMEVHVHGYEYITYPVRFMIVENEYTKADDGGYVKTDKVVVKIS